MRVIAPPRDYDEPTQEYVEIITGLVHGYLSADPGILEGTDADESSQAIREFMVTGPSEPQEPDPVLMDMIALMAGGSFIPGATPTAQHAAILKHAMPELAPGATPTVKAVRWLQMLRTRAQGGESDNPGEVRDAAERVNRAFAKAGERNDPEEAGKTGGKTGGMSIMDIVKRFLEADLSKVSLKLDDPAKRIAIAADVRIRETPGGLLRHHRGIRGSHELQRMVSSDKAAMVAAPILGLSRIVTGDAGVAMPAERRANKQLALVLIDSSGSMDADKCELAAAVLNNRIAAANRGEAEVFWMQFNHACSAVHPASKPFRPYPQGGTDIPRALGRAIHFIRDHYDARYGEHPDIILVTDGEDNFREETAPTIGRYRIRVNLILVSCPGKENSPWVDYCESTGGRVWKLLSLRTGLVDIELERRKEALQSGEPERIAGYASPPRPATW